MPREPDLGSGRPGAGTSPPSNIAARTVSGLSRPDKACLEPAGACAGGLALLDSFQDQALRGLAMVKAEIDADRKARAAGRI